jgi:hypothetical protein
MKKNLEQIAWAKAREEFAKQTEGKIRQWAAEAKPENNALLMMLLKQAQLGMPARVALLEMIGILAGVGELLESIEHQARQQLTDEQSNRRYMLQQDVGTLHTQVDRLVYLANQLGNTRQHSEAGQ